MTQQINNQTQETT